MAKVPMKVIGDFPFRGVAPGGVLNVSLKDSRAFANVLAPVDAPKKVAAKKAPARKAAAKKAPAKKAGTYRTRALKAR